MKRQITLCMFIAGLSALLFLLAPGCGAVRQQPEPMNHYVLHYDPPGKTIPSGITKPVTVHVSRIQASVPYNTNHMIYSETPYHRARYAYHQWMIRPADMVTRLLERDIQSVGTEDAFAITTARRDATHRIEGEIVDFYEDDEKQQWEAVLTLRLALIRIHEDGMEEETLFRRIYSERVVLEKNNPHSLARSMSMAMEAVSKHFIADMAESLRRQDP